ncbi:protein of unknown function [Georgfuchsia toluolica]|uniref:Uncharacterized protein n=1 Tax=Georgfuchsia toluolica TaxID=424218 RepID=A0A916N9J8_9PROT|nr:protein of unknown function [Georgfuchsia toluolica]
MELINIVLHLVAPRPLLVIAVMVSALSVCVRYYTIEAVNLKRVSRQRSTFYGNCMGIATAIFTFPTAVQIVATSTGNI